MGCASYRSVDMYDIYKLDKDTNILTVDMRKIKDILKSLEFIPEDALLTASVERVGRNNVLSIFLDPIIEFCIFPNVVLMFEVLTNDSLYCTAVYNVFDNPRVIKVVVEHYTVEMVNVLADLLVEKTVYSYT